MLEAQKKAALYNWTKKNVYLQTEIEKYSTYVNVLESSPDDIANSVLTRRLSMLSPARANTVSPHGRSQQDLASKSFKETGSSSFLKSPIGASFLGRSFRG